MQPVRDRKAAQVLTVIDADVILHPMYFAHISNDIAESKEI